MMRAHQPGSQPLDIPEAIPNPAVPRPAPAPSPAPREPVKVPAPQGAVAIAGNNLRQAETCPPSDDERARSVTGGESDHVGG